MHSFTEAVQYLKAGCAVRRDLWPEGIFLRMNITGFVFKHFSDGTSTYWEPSQLEIFGADNWELLPDD